MTVNPQHHLSPRNQLFATQRKFGPEFHADGRVTFHVWAPGCNALFVQFADRATERPIAMQRDDAGMFSTTVAADAGELYWVRLANGALRPDPASRFQPRGVHGPSQLVNPCDFHWSDWQWAGVAKQDLILYELHLGTFTQQGTYAAAMQRLDELLELGITAIELMPLAETAGQRNWGYDGVNWFAPRCSYGTPDELRQLINAAHRSGLAVILDVVYNHFGPEGNYLHALGGYVSARHKTAWGDAPNYDEEHSQRMRQYVVANAIYWIQDYHFDGLRLDALHCMADESKPHVVTEIGQAFDQYRRLAGPQLHLIAESNVYDSELLSSLDSGGHGYDALWCDDFLHSVFATLCPGQHMSNREYEPHSDLHMVLQRGFVFEGSLHAFPQRIPLSQLNPCVQLPSLISSIQHHDFIGNHPAGLRLHQRTSREAHCAAAALLLMFPATPMLFMGEEFATESPFLFFADFGDEPLRVGVEQGRRREYPQHHWTDVESPLALATFKQSYIGKSEEGDPHTLRWYRDLIRLRKNWRKLGLLDPSNMTARWDSEGHYASIVYRHADRVLTAIVRLHPPSDPPPPLHVQFSGKVWLSQSCVIDENSSGHGALGAFGVLIGDGTIH